MGMLRDLIDKNLDEISRRIDVPRSNIHQHAVTTEERLSKILWCLMNDQPAQGARQRLATVITDVIGKRWKKDVAKYIADIDIKGEDSQEVTRLYIAASPQTYGTTEQGTGCEVIGIDAKMSGAVGLSKKMCGIIFIVGILLIMLCGALVALPTLAYRNPSQSNEIWVQEGDTVILERIKSSEYKDIEVWERLKNEDSDHSIDAFLLSCHDLTNHFTTIYFQSRTLYLYSSTYLLGEQPGNTPIYLLAGSSVSYRFLISANLSLSAQPEFFVFDNYNDYREFIFGKMEGVKKAIYRQELSVGSPQNPKLTEIIFTPPKDGYYFITGYSEAGVSYQFNATDYVQYLNVSDYIGKYPTCRFNSELSCSFTTDTAFLGTDAKYCLIADIERPFSEDPPSTHIEVHTKKRYDILVIPGVVAVVSGIALVTVSFVAIVASIAKRRSQSRSGYTSIQ